MTVNGKRIVTTAPMAKTWKAKSVVMPTMTREPKRSLAFSASQ